MTAKIVLELEADWQDVKSTAVHLFDEGVAEGVVVGKAIINAGKVVFNGLKPTLLSEFVHIVTTGLTDYQGGDLAAAEAAVMNMASADLQAALSALKSGWIQVLIGMVKGL